MISVWYLLLFAVITRFEVQCVRKVTHAILCLNTAYRKKVDLNNKNTTMCEIFLKF